MLLSRKTETTLFLLHLLLHPPHNIQREGLSTVQVSLRQVAMMIDSSIYMWAYTGENILSALPSKIFPGVISHMVSKGGIQGFSKKNDY